MATIERQWSDLLSALFMPVPISDLAIRCGIYLAAFAAFSINGAAELWRTFALETGGGSGGLTHPSSPERSARAMLVVVDVAHKKRNTKRLLPDDLPDPEVGEVDNAATKNSEQREE